MNVKVLDKNSIWCNDVKEFFLCEKIDISLYQDVKSLNFENDKFQVVFITDSFSKNEIYKNLLTIKSDFPHSYVSLLSDNLEEEDIIFNLEMGFDECFPRKLNPRLLVAKIKCILRKNYLSVLQKPTLNNSIYSAKYNLKIDLDSRVVLANDQKVNLTKTEFEILRFLMENTGAIKSREDIINSIKTFYSDTIDRTIDSQICKIRQKINKITLAPNIIKTIRGYGYIFSES